MLDKLSLSRSNFDREKKATGRERKFLASLDRFSIGRGQLVDRFLNRLSHLAITSIG